jgi:hypothetical protein
MRRQLLLSALRHADGREMKDSLWQAFRVFVVDVTFKVCVAGGHGLPCDIHPKLLSTKLIYFSQTTPRLRLAIWAMARYGQQALSRLPLLCAACISRTNRRPWHRVEFTRPCCAERSASP